MSELVKVTLNMATGDVVSEPYQEQEKHFAHDNRSFEDILKGINRPQLILNEDLRIYRSAWDSYSAIVTPDNVSKAVRTMLTYAIQTWEERKEEVMAVINSLNHRWNEYDGFQHWVSHKLTKEIENDLQV